MDGIDWKKFYDDEWSIFRWKNAANGGARWYDPDSDATATPKQDWEMFMKHLSEDNPRAHAYLAAIVLWRINRGT